LPIGISITIMIKYKYNFYFSITSSISQLGAEMEILTKNSSLNSILLKAFDLC